MGQEPELFCPEPKLSIQKKFAIAISDGTEQVMGLVSIFENLVFDPTKQTFNCIKTLIILASEEQKLKYFLFCPSLIATFIG